MGSLSDYYSSREDRFIVDANGARLLNDLHLHHQRGAVVQWLAHPLVTPAARVRAPDQAHY